MTGMYNVLLDECWQIAKIKKLIKITRYYVHDFILTRKKIVINLEN